MKAKALFTNTYFLLTMLVMSVVATIFLFYRYKKLQEDRKIMIDKINQRLDEGIGAETGDIGVKGLLLGTQDDPNYNGLKDAKALKSAIGYIYDNDDVVYNIIKGKTKAQLKSIQTALSKEYGYASWDAYLNDVFESKASINPFKDFDDTSNCFGNDCGKFTKALNMIKQAK